MAAAAAEAAGARGVLRDVRIHVPTNAGAGTGQAARRRRPARHDPPRACPVPAGLAERRERPDDLAADKQEHAGSGALGDIGAHIIDTAQWLTGQSITGVSALLETFVTSRPLSGDRVGLGGQGDVGDDMPRGDGHRRRRRAVHSPGSTAARSAPSRPPGSHWAARTRCGSSSTARPVRWRSTSRTTTCWSSTTAPNPASEQGFRRILVTEPDHPYVGAWWPPGHGLGYEHGFTHQVVDLVNAIGERPAAHPVLRRRAPGPAGARRRRGERRAALRLDNRPRLRPRVTAEIWRKK